MFTKPLTASISPAILTMIRFYVPAHAADHLVQAWDALEAARRGDRPEAHMSFARNRLACALSEPVARAVKPRQRKAYEAECAELAAALA